MCTLIAHYTPPTPTHTQWTHMTQTIHIAHVHRYHTGTLYLGYINGPTEGLKVLLLTYGLTGIYGKISELTIHKTHTNTGHSYSDLNKLFLN